MFFLVLTKNGKVSFHPFAHYFNSQLFQKFTLFYLPAFVLSFSQYTDMHAHVYLMFGLV